MNCQISIIFVYFNIYKLQLYLCYSCGCVNFYKLYVFKNFFFLLKLYFKGTTLSGSRCQILSIQETLERLFLVTILAATKGAGTDLKVCKHRKSHVIV